MPAQRSLRACLCLLAGLTLGCRPEDASVHAAALSRGCVRIEAAQLPADWASCSRSIFERRLATYEPEVPSEADLAALRAGLDVEGQVSVRAALLLAHLAEGPGASRACERLLERLEARHEASARALDAGDVVAAAALARHDLEPRQLDALVELAAGATHHPDLEVRVECASVALGQGRDEVGPFLLRVLRAWTPSERLDPADWPRKQTMAWAKSRAAEALSRRAGRPCSFEPDSSFADQEREADALAAALGL